MTDSKRWLGRDLTVVAVCQLAAGGRQTEDRIRNGLRSRQIANRDQVGCRSIEGRAIYDGVKPNHRGPVALLIAARMRPSLDSISSQTTSSPGTNCQDSISGSYG